MFKRSASAQSIPLLLALSCAGYLAAFGCSAKGGGSPGDGDSLGDGDSSGGLSGDGDVIIDGTGGNSGGPQNRTPSGRIRPSDLGSSFGYMDPSGHFAYKSPNLGDQVGTLFGGEVSQAGAAKLVYPFDKSMHPINVLQMNFQWEQGAASNTIFRLEFSGSTAAGTTVTHYFYVGCSSAQCSFEMPDSEWWDLADTHFGQSVIVTIAGTDSSGSSVTRSAPSTIHFTPKEVNGAVYYWAANQAILKRASMGAGSAADFIVSSLPGGAQSPTNQFECVGCHSVSRDGEVIAFSVDTEKGHGLYGAIQVAPTADPENPIIEPGCCDSPYTGAPSGKSPTDQFGSYVALSPDGQLAAISGVTPQANGSQSHIKVTMRRVGGSNAGTDLQVYDNRADIFTMADTSPTNGLIAFMEFSPNGSQIVATRQPSHSGYADAGNTRLVTLDVDAQTGALSNMKILVLNQPNWTHYFPTWSPDGHWIVFASAPDAGAPDEWRTVNGNQNGVLRMIRVADAPVTCPGEKCYELQNATQYPVSVAATLNGKHTTWPKFTPFSQGPLMFVSYTSKVNYGFLTNGTTQIWMAAIDTSKADAEEPTDPSFAPIWLPYQSVNDSSFSPFWTEKLPCSAEGGSCSGCVGNEKCFVSTDTSGEQQCECRTETIR